MSLKSLETHSARLLRSVEFLLASAGWELKSLGLVAVASGPGSFTGIRIGVATGLGLAQTLQIPMVTVSVLDALAHSVQITDGELVVAMDAQRSQVYCAGYRLDAGTIRRTTRPALRDPAELRRSLAGRKVFLAGDALVSHARELAPGGSHGWPRRLDVDLFVAEEVGRLGLSRKRQWRSGDWLTAEPLYIRPPDAAMKRKNGH